MSQLSIRGSVAVEGGDPPVAGVTVVALLAALDPSMGGPADPGRIELGRALTGSDGGFAIDTNDQDPGVARWACALRSCSDFQFHLGCFDADGTLLHETPAISYREPLSIAIELPEQDYAPTGEDWEELGDRILDAQSGRLDVLARELATLAPQGLFASWTVARRLGTLGRLEQAVLDPENLLAQAGVRIRFSRLGTEGGLRALHEELDRIERPDLGRELASTLRRAQAFGGFEELVAYVNPEKLKTGDILGGVNEFLNPDFGIEALPWLVSPSVGYRDYLRDRWCDHQRFEPVLGGPAVEVASRATMVRRLNSRFHQDFATRNTTEQPANRVLVGILLTILSAPAGTGYGFGLAPASIDGQGDRTFREYLDYLISLSGLPPAELEKRYRLNLRRSDLERSSLVQQNIETLQRFFTDSYQSVDDPFPVAPDRKAGTPELLIFKFPPEAAGPFFLEYEEWLQREAPFYPENHYDPRATYQWILWERFQKTREITFAKSMPLATFLDKVKTEPKFDTGSTSYNHVEAKWQWARNHIELWDVVVAGHNDAKSLNYVGAEEK